ncbi:MAG: PAS domain S-box protein [Ignavibacteriales bacterium]|nr:PAS domain S-box protein [Ignavibacteriales bacterium]
MNNKTKYQEVQPPAHQNGEMFRKAFYESPLAKTIAELPTGKILHVNNSFLRLMESSLEEVLGRTVFELDMWVSPFGREEFLERIQHTGKVENIEKEARTKSGMLRTILASASIIECDTKQCLTATFVDVSREKMLERNHYESERRYRSLIDNAIDVIFTISLEGNFTSLNPAFETITGWKESEWLGKSFIELLHPDDVPNALAQFQQHQRGEHVQHAEYRIRTKTQSYVIGDFTTSVQVEKGNIVGVFGIGRDITERKRIEEETRIAEQRFEKIFRTSPMGMSLSSLKDGIIIDVNEFFLQLFGYEREESIGETGNNLNIWVNPEARLNMISILQAKGRVQDFEAEMRAKSGAIIWVLGSIELIKYNNEKFLLTMFQDITERKRIEIEFQAQQKLLTEAQRIARLGSWEFVPMENKLLWTNEMYDVYGVSPDKFSLSIENFLSLIHPDDTPAMLQWLEQTSSGKNAGELEFRSITPDGEIRSIVGSGTSLMDENGNLVRLFGTAQDITERKNAEEILKAKTEELNKFFNTSLGLLCIADTDGYFRRLNPEWEKTLGYSVQEMEGKKFFDFIHPDDIASTIAAVTDLTEQKEIFDFVNRYKHKDGTYRWIEWRSTPFGKIIYASARDITERKQADKLQQVAYRIAQVTSQSETLNEVYFAAHLFVQEILPAENFYIALFDDKKNELSFPYFKDEFDEQPSSRPLHKGLTEYVLRTGESILCNAEQQQELTERNEIENIGAPAPIWLGVPLIVEKKTVGVMVVQHYTNPSAYGEREKKMLEFVSSQIAHTILNKQSQNELEESEKRYRDLFESNPLPMYVMDDATLHIRKVNQSAITHYGYSAEEFLSKTILDIRPKEDLPKLMQKLSSMERKRDSGIWKHQKKDGTVMDVEIVSSPILYDEKPARIVSINDITERKRLEQEREKLTNDLLLLMESTVEGIYGIDTNGNCTFINKSARKMFGLEAKDILGKNVHELMHHTHANGLAYPLEDCPVFKVFETATGCTITGEVFWKKDGTSFPVEYSSFPVVEKGEIKGVVVSFTDVTEKKQLEQQFLRAQRMESIGTLAGGIAHDLNNVLSPIMLAIEILKKRFPDERSVQLINRLESSAQRGADIVKQVLLFARGAEGEKIALQVKHLLKEMEKIMRETFPKNIQLVSDIPNTLKLISGDATQIHQVLMNLCVNARDAMPEGGTLSLTAENIFLDENTARMNIDAHAGEYLHITVADTGEGIPKELIDKIFDPFFTTKEIGKGTGLGLSTVRTIVKSHGGFLNVYSEPNNGTKFSLYFPVSTSSQAEAIEKSKDITRGNGELILIVDDEFSIREITKLTLEDHNYRVLLAGDGTEALAAFAENKKDIHLVLIDMMMPNLDGPATIKVLRKMNPEIKIIGASGLVEKGHLEQLSGVNEFLPKPYRAEVLLETIAGVLRGK